MYADAGPFVFKAPRYIIIHHFHQVRYAILPRSSRVADIDSNNSPQSPRQQATASIVACAFAFTPPAVPAPAKKRSSTSRKVGFCGWCSYGRRPARPLATRQTPRFPQNLPTQLGGRAEKNSGRWLTPWLHPEWSTSRVSLGSRAKGTQRAGQNHQSRVILWGYHLFSWCTFGAIARQKVPYNRATQGMPGVAKCLISWLVRRTSKAMPVGINHQFKPISHSQLGKDGREVVSYRRLADAQAIGDLFVP